MRCEHVEASSLCSVMGALQPFADEVGKLRRLRLFGGGWRRRRRSFRLRRDVLGTVVTAGGERQKGKSAEECRDGVASRVVMVPIAPVFTCEQRRKYRNCYRGLRSLVPGWIPGASDPR